MGISSVEPLSHITVSVLIYSDGNWCCLAPLIIISLYLGEGNPVFWLINWYVRHWYKLLKLSLTWT